MNLTLPSVDHGMCRILAGKNQVGHAYTVWDERDHWNGAWVACLWATANCRDSSGETVRAFRLRELRALLKERLSAKGPWWS